MPSSTAEGPEFYQYIERDFQGEKSTPWEGGRYGFVRNPVDTSRALSTPASMRESTFAACIAMRGVNLWMMSGRLRTAELFIAIAAAGFSNYGRYIVIEHVWDGSPYYSLYGHLSEIVVNAGSESIAANDSGAMGYSGEGLNQARAHLHLELNLMFNRNFESWHDHFFINDPNHNGMYNGINLAGLDIARFFLELRKRPDLTVPEFLAEEEMFYKVAVPNRRTSIWQILSRGWLKNRQCNGESWEVSLIARGVPLQISQPGARSRTEVVI